MHDLIGRLSAEHTELEQALAGIRARQFKTPEGRERLHRVRDLLRSHFQTEHDELYPPLQQAVTSDERLAGQLRRFSEDLEIVSGLADDFVRKYEGGISHLIEFATDHGALMTILRIRLKREEETLFPLYRTIIRN
ncbi:hemerythrin domain-containing protein [candidate division WOR-3 bacterium]|nr:hemerythrin domain-containing protein [candidate division WOR-3 bacterium]